MLSVTRRAQIESLAEAASSDQGPVDAYVRKLSKQFPASSFRVVQNFVSNRRSWNIAVKGKRQLWLLVMDTPFDVRLRYEGPTELSIGQSAAEGGKVHKAQRFPTPPSLRQIEAYVSKNLSATSRRLLEKGEFTDPNAKTSSKADGPKAAPIAGIEQASVSFEAIDEWHDTAVAVVLRLSAPGTRVSDRDVQKWLQANWGAVQNQLRGHIRFPRPAARDWNSDGFERPAHGLGWVDPTKAKFSEGQLGSVSRLGSDRVQANIIFTHR